MNNIKKIPGCVVHGPAVVGWTGSELLKKFFGILNSVKVTMFLKPVIVHEGE